MNSEERQLITDLFDRIRSNGPLDKDRDADMLISSSMRQNPDAAYLLVQSILVQDHALQMSEQRMQELEQQVADLEAQQSRPQPAQSSGGGSFLGGLFGGGSGPSRQAPQPVSAGRASAGFGAPPARAGGYGSPSVPASGANPWGAPAAPQQAAAPQPAAPAPAAGGGFMRQAMTTAAGVAGGMLVANSISSMLGGSHGSAHASEGNSAFGTSGNHGNTNSQLEDAHYTSGDNDPGSSHVADNVSDDGSDIWGGDDSEV